MSVEGTTDGDAPPEGEEPIESGGPDQPEESVDRGEEVQVVEFKLGGDTCAVDIDQVDGIVEMKKVTRIPRTPEAIDGVMDLRGETTAIIDLRSFLGIDEQDDRQAQDVLVLDRPDDKQKVGLRVDEVQEVSTYYTDRIDSDEDLANLQTTGFERRAARGIIRKPNDDDVDLIVWVDVEAIIDGLK